MNTSPKCITNSPFVICVIISYRFAHIYIEDVLRMDDCSKTPLMFKILNRRLGGLDSVGQSSRRGIGFFWFGWVLNGYKVSVSLFDLKTWDSRRTAIIRLPVRPVSGSFSRLSRD